MLDEICTTLSLPAPPQVLRQYPKGRNSRRKGRNCTLLGRYIPVSNPRGYPVHQAFQTLGREFLFKGCAGVHYDVPRDRHAPFVQLA